MTGKTQVCETCGSLAALDYGTAALDGSPFDAAEFDAVEYYECAECGEDTMVLIRPDGTKAVCNDA